MFEEAKRKVDKKKYEFISTHDNLDDCYICDRKAECDITGYNTSKKYACSRSKRRDGKNGYWKNK